MNVYRLSFGYTGLHLIWWRSQVGWHVLPVYIGPFFVDDNRRKCWLLNRRNGSDDLWYEIRLYLGNCQSNHRIGAVRGNKEHKSVWFIEQTVTVRPSDHLWRCWKALGETHRGWTWHLFQLQWRPIRGFYPYPQFGMQCNVITWQTVYCWFDTFQLYTGLVFVLTLLWRAAIRNVRSHKPLHLLSGWVTCPTKTGVVFFATSATKNGWSTRNTGSIFLGMPDI